MKGLVLIVMCVAACLFVFGSGERVTAAEIPPAVPGAITDDASPAAPASVAAETRDATGTDDVPVVLTAFGGNACADGACAVGDDGGGFMSAGPVRRAIAAPVRFIAKRKPLRFIGRLVLRGRCS